MLRAAIIGFGGIAKGAHLPAYPKLAEEGLVTLVAVCDIRPERFTEVVETNLGASKDTLDASVHTYTDWQEMLKNEQVDFVDICVPTYLHAEITIGALNMGVNVLCEKPMSLNSADCQRMIDAAKANGKKLMIGQCLRFGNKYNYLKKVVDEKTFGEVKTGVFKRLSSPPIWAWENWFMDYNKSHGCLTDMHIHDIDLMRYLFGEPESVSCLSQDLYSGKDIAHSTLRYPGFSMLAIGDWSQQGLPFATGFTVAFEKATLQQVDGGVMVYPRGVDAKAYKVEIEDNSSYYEEIKFFAGTIANSTENTKNPPESAAKTIALIEALTDSSNNNGDFVPFA